MELTAAVSLYMSSTTYGEFCSSTGYGGFSTGTAKLDARACSRGTNSSTKYFICAHLWIDHKVLNPFACATHSTCKERHTGNSNAWKMFTSGPMTCSRQSMDEIGGHTAKMSSAKSLEENRSITGKTQTNLNELRRAGW